MEGAVTLEVPNKVDYESGTNWGEHKMIYGIFKCKHTSNLCSNKKRVSYMILQKHHGEVEDCIIFGISSITGK